MDNEKVIAETVSYVREMLKGAEGGHDWFHIERVWKNTKLLLQSEPGRDPFICELAALLHDVADPKFHDGDETIAPKTIREWLESQEVAEEAITHVLNVVAYMSFKSSIDGQKWTSPELELVQDADRLDALGAIGIARTFNYGGHKGRALYDPKIKPNLHMTKDEYKNSSAPTLNHFYEKLFLLKERMNTQTGKQIAAERHEFMEMFVERFHDEWDGKK